jgi:nitrogen fixation protein NifB
MKCNKQRVMHGHPCLGGNRHKNGRVHLAVAPRCNISCAYCERKHDCANESRPGVTSRLQTPQSALEHLRHIMSDQNMAEIIKVVGIAGPGDPLANDETFETFRLVKEVFPHLILCMSTNGLLLPDRMHDLEQIGLHSLTVTINALSPEVGSRIYRQVTYNDVRFQGVEGAALLIDHQIEGVRLATERGMVVKVNTVLIPGCNDGQVPLIADTVSQLGAFVMNVMPLIPCGALKDIVPPTPEYLEMLRSANEQVIPQFRHCSQCRADAYGLIGV